MGKLHFCFFFIREASHALSLYQRLALVRHVAQHAGRMADQSDRLARIIKRLEQSDRHRALGKIPHRPMPAGVKYRVEVFRLHIGELDRVGERLLRRRVFLEASHRWGLVFRLIAFGIEWRLPALWGCERQFDTGIFEHEVRGREFF